MLLFVLFFVVITTNKKANTNKEIIDNNENLFSKAIHLKKNSGKGRAVIEGIKNPPKNEIDTFDIKKVDKNKLYEFLREMEFNRLLSQAISFYGEPEGKIVQQNTKSISKKIDVAKY